MVVDVPENSEASVSQALRLGFPAVEIDVRKTKDNELVLFHGNTGSKDAGMDVGFSELTLDQLKD